ncbi:hypothetical protein JI435_079230 [Parastagonospora nodorum SN15]|uniref:Uncharacterized protein n=1 Tax=Phaeosphaeria nodorum (strain SN15 / ATCC MYA-4574 / FGSC 10173) TaxID=321614 RepID=A0A7U2HYR5_PHANO|nr:hypothetical protein HBH46_220130 [Parastagonospora nodorum]QRC93027.1 hypothetical protein JI435_079230 [Parastagonospora nodorum SN15]KAH5237711.1 hypothetical protein HBI72_233450 [Parastagonospora nodorum]KAH5390933.1 hypothetical protein HBI32_238500 [Parastagonospora nodorum]KAH5784532.1 hypothetical protein HBI96_238150 [Parastagonospora nodorum]
MSSYVITGVSRGIGAAFLKNLASNPSNTVVGLVRSAADTEARIAEWRTPNVHILQADVTDYESLKKAAEATSAITSGSLDYLIANAAMISRWSSFDPLTVLGKDPKKLTDDLNDAWNTNVLGNIHLINLFMPLVLKGRVKKVVTITSGMADHDLAIKYGIYEGGPYSISKAAMNMVTSKYQAEFEKDGVLFMGICPGMVDTGIYADLSEEDTKKLEVQGAKFMKYAPHFTGPDNTEDSVKAILGVVESKSLANGDGGAYVSHFGNKQWI